jgi:hypothetical protein
LGATRMLTDELNWYGAVDRSGIGSTLGEAISGMNSLRDATDYRDA